MKIKDIQPTENNILIEPSEKPKEVGGLVLSGNQRNDAPVRGTVIKVGPGSKFKAGDTLFFRKYAIDELNYLDENAKEQVVWLVDEREVLAVIPS